MGPKKILAIKFRSFGDTVILSSSIEAIRQAFPRAEIHLALLKEWAPLFEHHPGVNKVWTHTKHRERTARARSIARLTLRLRKEHYDTVLNFHASPSSALLALGTGAKKRAIHFHGLRDKNRYSTTEIPGKGVVKPILERDMDTVRSLGVSIEKAPMPRVVPLEEEELLAKETLSALKPPFLGMGIGASRPTKIWPLERMIEVAKYWEGVTSGTTCFFLGPGEETLKDRMERIALERKEDLPRSHFFIGMELRALTSTLKQMKVFLGNDSGPKHLSVALNVPTVTVIGPEHPHEWHPYPQDRHSYLFVENLSCRQDALPGYPPWCGLEVCTKEGHRCMREIPVSSVTERIKVALTQGESSVVQ